MHIKNLLMALKGFCREVGRLDLYIIVIMAVLASTVRCFEGECAFKLLDLILL